MKRKIIGAFLLFVLCIQVVPVIVLGAAFYRGLVNEEISLCVAAEKCSVSNKEANPDLDIYSFNFGIACFLSPSCTYFYYSAPQFSSHCADIVTPPPDFC